MLTPALPGRVRALAPGVIAAAVIAAAAMFLSQHYGAPVMLFALLLGMAMNFLSAEGPCAPGIAFSARTLLRVGVALLGVRITAGAVAELGWQPVPAGGGLGGADHRRVDGRRSRAWASQRCSAC